MKIKMILAAMAAMVCAVTAATANDNAAAADRASDGLIGDMTVQTASITLGGNWQLQQDDKTTGGGELLSTPNANVEGWYEANVPSTVMGALTRDNGLYADLLEGTNYKNADRTPFDDSWWYRTAFEVPQREGRRVTLDFDGLSYRANIWLNGKLVASKDEVFGVFRRWSFDVTELVKDSGNVLAVEIFRAQKGEPNIGFVDWNPRPLDESMGIFREVRVNVTGDVTMRNSRVKSLLNTQTLKEAYLDVETELENLSSQPIEGVLKGRMEQIEFAIPVTLAAGEKRTVLVSPDVVPELHIRNPRVWWSVGLGTPELYELDLEFVVGETNSASQKVTFGIRSIDTYLTDEGHKGFILNGKKVLIKGAGWTDEIFLRDTPESNERQVRYVKDMNLNTIRFENIWGNSQNIYDLCDRYGILALVGWSCQWEWEGYIGTPEDDFMNLRSEEDMQLMVRYFDDQVKWLRNHPSIIAWYGGSDKLLRPELERRYMALLPTIDDRPFVNSAKRMMSSVTGLSGMKM
ncbi:MAG: glycoside hydrolase family 2, partial [Alistipes sp.]|nr:glycoside hydrolase family 2 [Alistipes sp.]